MHRKNTLVQTAAKASESFLRSCCQSSVFLMMLNCASNNDKVACLRSIPPLRIACSVLLIVALAWIPLFAEDDQSPHPGIDPVFAQTLDREVEDTPISGQIGVEDCRIVEKSAIRHRGNEEWLEYSAALNRLCRWKPLPANIAKHRCSLAVAYAHRVVDLGHSVCDSALIACEQMVRPNRTDAVKALCDSLSRVVFVQLVHTVEAIQATQLLNTLEVFCPLQRGLKLLCAGAHLLEAPEAGDTTKYAPLTKELFAKVKFLLKQKPGDTAFASEVLGTVTNRLQASARLDCVQLSIDLLLSPAMPLTMQNTPVLCDALTRAFFAKAMVSSNPVQIDSSLTSALKSSRSCKSKGSSLSSDSCSAMALKVGYRQLELSGVMAGAKVAKQMYNFEPKCCNHISGLMDSICVVASATGENALSLTTSLARDIGRLPSSVEYQCGKDWSNRFNNTTDANGICRTWFAQSYYRVGDSLWILKDSTGAENALRRALAFDDEFALALFKLGLLDSDHRYFDTANMNTAAELAEDDNTLRRLFFGFLEIARGELEEAKEYFDHLIKAGSLNHDAWYGLALTEMAQATVYRSRLDYENCKLHCELSLARLDSACSTLTDRSQWFSFSQSAPGRSRFANDISRVKNLLAVANRGIKYQSSLAKAQQHFDNGEWSDAIKLWQPLLKKDFTEIDLAIIQFNIGAAYYKLSEPSKANIHFVAATEKYPAFSDAHYWAGITYSQDGSADQTDQCVTHIAKAFSLGLVNMNICKVLKKFHQKTDIDSATVFEACSSYD